MMVRRSAACRCVRTSSSKTRKPSARAISGSLRRRRDRTKQDSQNQKSKSCWSRSSMSEASSTVSLQWVLATGPDDQSASLQRDPAAFASISAREETRVVAGQIVAASNYISLRQCTCSQRPEHPAFHLAEKNITWSCSVWLFSFPQAQGDHQGDPFWRRGGHQEGRNDGAEGHPRRILPSVNRSVAEDGKVP